MSLRITCRQASHLLSRREDEPLGSFERFKLWAHMKFCDACTNVARQFETIRLAMRRFRDGT